MYGAVFFVFKINQNAVRPLKFSLWRKSYAHMRLKKRFKIFFSLEFHFIQFKKRKIFHNPRAAPKGIKPALRMKNLSFLNRMKWNYKRNKAYCGKHWIGTFLRHNDIPSPCIAVISLQLGAELFYKWQILVVKTAYNVPFNDFLPLWRHLLTP